MSEHFRAGAARQGDDGGHPSSLSRTFERGMRLAFVLLAALEFLGWWPTYRAMAVTIDASARAALWALMAVLASMCVSALVNGGREVWAWLGVTVSLVSLVVLAQHHASALPGWWPEPILYLVISYCHLAINSWRRWLPILLLIVGNLGAHLGLARQPDVFSVIFGLTAQVSMAVTVALFISGIRGSAREADGILAERLARQRRDREVETAALALEESERIVHDTLIHGLRAINLVGHGLEPREATQACEQALRDLGRRLDDGKPVRLDKLAATSARTLGLHARIEGRVRVEEPAAAAALGDALEEALRNVALHAGTREVAVHLSQHEEAVTVEVRDHGRGFDPTRMSPGHRGISESIVGRLEAIGGRAAIDSAPGEGTTVSLAWDRAADDDRVPELLQSLSRRVGHVAAVLPLPAMFLTVLVGFFDAWVRPTLWPALLASLVVLAAGCALALRGDPRRMRPPWVLSIFLLSVIASWINLAVSPDNDGRHMWTVGVAGLLLLPIIAVTEEFVAAVVGVGFVVAVEAAALLRFAPTELLGPMGGMTVSIVGSVVFGLVGRDFIRTQTRRVQREAQGVVALRAHTQLVQQRAEQVARRLAALDGATVLVRAVAQGLRRPDDAEVQERARLLEWEARDVLQVHGAVPPPVARMVWALRSAAWRVVLNVDARCLERSGVVVQQVLGALLPARPGTVTLSCDETELTVVVVAPQAENLVLGPASIVEADQDFCLATAPLGVDLGKG